METNQAGTLFYKISQANFVCKDSRFIDNSLYQKLLISVQICWRYLKISQVSVFFWDTVYC